MRKCPPVRVPGAEPGAGGRRLGESFRAATISPSALLVSTVALMPFAFSQVLGSSLSDHLLPPPPSMRTVAPDLTVRTGFLVVEKYPKIAFSGVHGTR